MLTAITQAIVNFNTKVDELVDEALNADYKPQDIVEAIRKGADEVGKKFADGEYFLSELIMAGEVMKTAFKVLGPHLKLNGMSGGRVVLGTIEGDLHDIGKDIVATLLVSSGFELFDLGIDVPSKRFADKAKEVNADIVGISCLLSINVPTIGKVVEELQKAGLRNKVKVIAGGAALREEYAKKLGIDAAVNDAVTGINIMKLWMSEKD